MSRRNRQRRKSNNCQPNQEALVQALWLGVYNCVYILMKTLPADYQKDIFRNAWHATMAMCVEGGGVNREILSRASQLAMKNYLENTLTDEDARNADELFVRRFSELAEEIRGNPDRN